MRLLLLLLFASPLLLASMVLPQSFETQFIQTVTNPSNKVLEYRGMLLFSSPTSFKWIYETPTKKEVCSDGLKLLIVDHDLEQVSSFYIDQGINIAQILKNAKHHRDNIYLATYQERQYTIALDSQKRLQSFAYFDKLENKVQILFQKMRYHTNKLSSEQLTCAYSIDYDMIHE
jgi:outer membrane lipoprotein carrier protein